MDGHGVLLFGALKKHEVCLSIQMDGSNGQENFHESDEHNSSSTAIILSFALYAFEHQV